MKDELYVMKGDFRAYNANLRLYKAAKQVYTQVVYEMAGLKGVSWNKIGRRESMDDSSPVIRLLNAKDRAEAEMLKYWSRIENVQTCIQAMTIRDRELVTEHFIDGKPQRELAEKYGCTEKQLERKINSAISAGIRGMSHAKSGNDYDQGR